MKRTYFDNTNVSENFNETKVYLEDACGGAVTDEQVWNELSRLKSSISTNLETSAATNLSLK